MNTIKKIITAISAAAFTLPVLSACEDEFEYTFIDPIEYTATAPVVEFINVSFESYLTNDYNTVYTSDDPNAKLITDDLNELAKYYRENYDSGSMFFLKYGIEPHPSLNKSAHYIAYDSGELRFVETFRIYDKDLGCRPDTPGIPSGIVYSFDSICIIKPLVTKYTGGEFSYEFGNNHDGYYIKYANVFYNDECFSTFYYNPDVPITQEWFENYLSENLIWSDTYEN